MLHIYCPTTDVSQYSFFFYLEIKKQESLLAESALPVDYQCRIESFKMQYFTASRTAVQ